MPSNYLQAADYATYGAPASTTTAQVQQASTLIDTYLKRPEGLIYGVDSVGNPAYMLNKPPMCALTLGTALAPGQAVTATVTGPTMGIQIGDVFTAEVNNSGNCENLVVNAVNGQQVQFAQVGLNHAIGATLTGGLLITEQRTMVNDRPITRVARWPIANMPSGVGRYGYLRRSDDGYSNVNTYNALAVMTKFGGPPSWEPFTPQANSIDPITGTLWIPAGVLLAYYTEVRVHYVAGWTYATLPDDIKYAVAQLVFAQQQAPLIGNVRAQQAGGTRLEYFAASQLNDDIKSLLEPYRARLYV